MGKETMHKSTFTKICIILLSIFFISTYAHAQSPEITNGLNWLKANQNADGSWGGVSAFRDTSTVIDTFKIIGESDTAYSNAINWIENASIESNDYIARRAASLADTGTDVTSDLQDFISNQNPDGGWGYYPGYESNVYDTAVILHAFKAAQFQDSNAIANAIDYLISKQNADGTWGFLTDAPGHVTTTSLVVETLINYGDSETASEAIDSGIAWLITKQNHDGGFGTSTSSVSTVYETALALNTLMMSGELQEQSLQNAINYVTSNQLSDGSWNENAYETAMAIKTLAGLKPNLSIFASDLHISNKTPKSGEIVEISAVVRNIGGEIADNIPVRIFAESPDNELIQIGTTVTIPLLEVNTASTVNVDFDTGGKQGDYKILVKIDEENSIEELTEEDNEVQVGISVIPVSDLVISGKDIVFSKNPVNIGEDVTINASISNVGNYPAMNIDIEFYYNTVSEETLIGQGYIPYLGVGKTASRDVIWKANKVGIDIKIYVVIDPQNKIDELIRANNQAVKTIEVVPVTDPNLTVSYQDIVITPNPAKELGDANISALVKNEGFSEASNIAVNFHKGVPGEGGTLLGTQTISSLSAGESSTVSLNWTNIPDSGERIIYIQADPDDLIKEIIEDDNDAFTTLKILSLPDLAISSNSITFTPSAPKDGDTVSINVTVQNKGEQGAPDVLVRAYEDSAVIGSQVIALIPGNSQAGASFTYDSTGKSGVHRITIIVDPDNTIPERSDDNNQASGTLGVQDADLWLTGRYISPNGDGIQDSTQFFFRLDVPQTARIIIVNENGAAVRTYSGSEFEDTGGGNILWDGLNDEGMVVDDGQYEIRVLDAGNNILGSLLVIVDNNRSSLAEAVGTDYLLNNNLSCLLPKIGDDQWEWVPNESKIVFSIPDTNFYAPGYLAGVYTMAPDGEDILRLIPGDWNDKNNPDYRYYDFKHYLSPDGNKIAFTFYKYDRVARETKEELWMVDTDGQNLTFLDSGINSYHTGVWSPDSNYFAYNLRDEDLGVWVVDIETLEKTLIFPYSTAEDIKWSLDSNKIAIDLDSEVLRVADRLGNIDEFSFDPEINAFDWLNNQRIVVNNREELWIIDAGGSGNKVKISENRVAVFDRQSLVDDTYIISPDGNNLAFIEYEYEFTDPFTCGYHSCIITELTLKVADNSGNTSVIYEYENENTIFEEIGDIPSIRKIIWSSDSRKITFYNRAIDRLREDSDLFGTKLFLTDVLTGDTENHAFITDWQYDYSLYDSSKKLELYIDKNNLLVNGDYGYRNFVINTRTWERNYLPRDDDNYSDPLLSPRGRYITYYQGVDQSGVCIGYKDLWAMSSLLNLTADLRVKKENFAVTLKGIAADLNFEGYMLEYADADNPDVWNLISPPSDMPVVNDVFTTWVPPYEGTFYVKLTVWDKAGNTAWDRKRVSWGLFSSITNIYRNYEIFSPNGDGIRDTVELHYRVLEPMHLELNIYDEDESLITTIQKDYTSPVEDYIIWDGRDSSGNVAPDGKYKIKVFTYEFFVEVDNTPPDTGLEVFWGCETQDKRVPELHVVKAHAADLNLKEWKIETSEIDSDNEIRQIINSGNNQFAEENSQTGEFLIPPRNTKAGGCLYVQEVTGKEFRITAEDYAGNVSVSSFVPDEGIFISAMDSDDHELLINTGETIIQPIDHITVQYKVSGDDMWTDDDVIYSADTNLSDYLIHIWDHIDIPLSLMHVRLKAVDNSGSEYFSNAALIHPEILELRDIRPPSIDDINNYGFSGFHNLEPGEGQLALQIAPSVYSEEWETIHEAILPEAGDFNTAIDRDMFSPCRGYAARFKATIDNEVILSNPLAFTTPCIQISYGYIKPEDCNTFSTGVEIKAKAELIGYELKELSVYLKYNENVMDIFNIESPVYNKEYSKTIETALLPPTGDYNLIGVLKYKEPDTNDGAVEEMAVSQPVTVDKIMPTAEIIYPDQFSMLCPLKYTDSEGDWYGIPVEGTVTDNSYSQRYKIFYGVGESPAVWLPAKIRNDNGNEIKEGSGPVQGQLGIWDVTELKGTSYSLKLEVTDKVGNKSCYIRKVTIDTLVEITNLTRDKYLFSPNEDGILDDINISYEINEYATVDVKAFKLIPDIDGSYILDSTPVRTIETGLQHLTGTGSTVWDGKDDSGIAAPDGKYGIVVFATDSCGNTGQRRVNAEIDNTPPSSVISYPNPADPLGNIVEIKGTTNDIHFQNYVLEYGEGEAPLDWMIISSDVVPVDGILGKWNTFNLIEGVWSLRLTALDIAGNSSSTGVTVDLAQRKNLIKSLDAAPELFSPNNDGRLDATSINYELTDACDITIEIFDSSDTLRKTYTDVTLSGGTYSYTWDGKDSQGIIMPDGDYSVKLTAALSSNTSVTHEEAMTVIVDATQPNVTIEKPEENSYLKSAVIVKGTISDENLREYTISYTGDSGTEIIDTANRSRENYTFGILNDLPEGNYSLNVTAKDLGETTTDKTIIFTIDRTPPKITLDIPKDGEYYGSDKNIINITGSIIEKNFETYSLRYGSGDNPAEWTELLIGDTLPVDPQLFVWKVGKDDGIPDGLYTLSLYARDKADFETEAKVKITIDNTPPEALISEPAEGSYVKEAVNVNGSAFDQYLDNYTIEFSEGNCNDAFKWALINESDNSVQNGVLATWQILPPDGDYCLRVTAVDELEQKAEAKVNVKVDTHSPAAPALSGEAKNKTDVRLTWTQNTEPDIAGYNLYRNNQTVNADLISDISYLDQNINEENYTYTVNAVDLAGLESEPSNEIKITIDLTGPDARIHSPQDASKVSGLVNIKGTAYSDNDFKQYRVYVGHGSNPSIWNLIRTSPVPVSYGALAEWDTISLAEEVYSVKLETEDIPGNINTHQITVTIDNTPPATPVLISAIPGSSDITVTWQANTESDLAGYLLYRNDQLVNASGILIGDLTSYLINATTYPDEDLPDGTFKYYLFAMDEAGNISDRSNSIEVNIDTHPPQAIIVEPEDSFKFEDKILIRSESPDIDIASIQFEYKKAEDIDWINLGDALTTQPYITYLDPVNLGVSYGNYNLRTVATDNGGRTDQSPLFITVTYTDLTAPDIPLDPSALTDGQDVTLSWIANTESDIDGYNIYRTQQYGRRTKINSAVVTDTTYTDRGFYDGIYVYEITAIDVYGNESLPSNSVSGKIYAPLIEQPYTPTGENVVLINGSDAEAESSVEITIEDVAISVLQVNTTSDADGNFISDIPLALGENRIIAKVIDSNGNISRASDEIVVVYNEPPAAPTGLTSNVNGYDVNLTWDPNTEPDLSGYNLYRNEEKVNVPSAVTSGSTTASSNSYNSSRAFDSNLSTYWHAYTYGNPDWWQIELPSPELISHIEIHWESEEYAGKDYEIQVWSGYAWITQATVTGNTEMENSFDFGPSYRTDKIRIYITDTTDTNYSKQVGLSEVEILRDNLITDTSYDDVDLGDGEHAYKVTAVDYYGFESLPSDDIQAAVGDVIPPSAPQYLTALASDSDIILGWSANSEPDLSGYNIYRDTPEGWSKINVSLITEAVYTDADLSNWTYTYRITAIDHVGNESDPSNEASASADTAPPLPPINLSVNLLPEGGALNALWEYVNGPVAGYNLYRGTASGGPYAKINDYLLSETSYLDTGLTNGISYYYVVIAVDSPGNESVYSNEATGIPADTAPPLKPEIYGSRDCVVQYDVRTNVFGSSEQGVTIRLFKDGMFAGKTVGIIEFAGEFQFTGVQLDSGENTFSVQAIDSSGNVSPLSEEICTIYDTSLLPDLETRSDDIFIYPSYPVNGDEVAITVAVRNKGRVDAENVEADIYLRDTSGNLELLKSENIPYMTPDSEKFVSITWDSTDKLGTNNVIVLIDPKDRIAEVSETNNYAARDIEVPDREGVTMTTTLDSDTYNSNQNMYIEVELINSGIERDVAVEVRVEDENGYVLKLFDTINTYISYGSPEKHTLVWNTGSTYTGSYKVHAILMNASDVIADNTIPFSIEPDIAIEAILTTDKTGYGAYEDVMVNLSVKSNGQNYIIPELTAKIRITDSENNILHTEDTVFTNLLPDMRRYVNSIWNAGLSAPGDYIAVAELYLDDQMISSKTALFNIGGPPEIAGTIAVDKQSLLQGETVDISYSVSNMGNSDISQIDLSTLIVHVVELTAYDTFTDQTALLIGNTYNNTQQLDTRSYSSKDYLVILRANISGEEETLANTYFRVEGAPSAPSLNWPLHGEDVETLIPGLIVNNASDPNDDRLIYEFELYADSGLTTLLASESGITESENITTWVVSFELEENAEYVWRARVYDGILYGDWMSPAAFRVNVENDAPTAPTLSSPIDGSAVDTYSPVVAVNNAFDPDSEELIYNFEVALDADFTNIVASEAGISAGTDTTSWQVPADLEENTAYYWRAQADDWLAEGPWMDTSSFFIDTANDAPSAPYIVEPLEGAEVSNLDTDVIADGAADPELAPLYFQFEADTAASFDSTELMSSGYIPEGDFETIWSIAGLTDNTTYYVRVNANDGLIDSPWSTVVSFFVNTINDAPNAPVLANPSDGGAVNVPNPTLSVHNSVDPDGDALTYEFEIYTETMTNPVANAAGVVETDRTTSWVVPVALVENETYYWRARAFDGELYGEWMPRASFMLNTANDAPGAPLLNEPEDGSSLETLTPTLAVENAVDPDNDSLTYDFEIYIGETLVSSFTGIAENDSGITSFTLDTPLSDNTTYIWRARAYDGDRYGAWMDAGTFSIHLQVDSITATIDFRPRTLNKASHGRWVVVFIELPRGYDVGDIDRSTILLEDTIPAIPWPYRIGDHDRDGKRDLMVKFKRSDVIDILPEGDEVPVTVTGMVGTTTFEGVDTIRVIPSFKWRHDPPHKRRKSNHYWKR